MKNKHFAFLIIILISILSCSRNQDNLRLTKKIDANWKFALQDNELAKDINFDDNAWQTLDLPHDWAIENPIADTFPSGMAGGFIKGGIGWYRKSIDIAEGYREKTIVIQFDGIYEKSDVWVNEIHVGHNEYGYGSHYYDITKHMIPGHKNLIAIRVDASRQPADRWYSGCGIYRHVWLHITNPLHIPVWGTYITTPEITSNEAIVRIDTKIKNNKSHEQKGDLVTEIFDNEGLKIQTIASEFTIAPNTIISVNQTLPISKPELWSPEIPTMYKAVSRIFTDGNENDCYTSSFGIRLAEFTSKNGFVLNNKKVLLKGVNLHHDAGCFGAAVPLSVWERRLDILKELGVNAIRLSHNPHMPQLLDLCDEKGFLVFNEINDKWAIPWMYLANPNDTALINAHKRIFHDNWKFNLDNFIERDKNHPSVIIWSFGNETLEQLLFVEDGLEIVKKHMEFIHQKDPSRKVTVGMHPGKEGENEVPTSYTKELDVLSYNYRTHQFKDWRKQYPNLIGIASETMQYNNKTPGFGFDSLDYSNNSWWSVLESNFIAGQFIWAGIDYLGESVAWPDKGLRGCIVYSNGIPKPHAWFTQSIYDEKPMVHTVVHDDSIATWLNNQKHWQIGWWAPAVVDHWNFPEKQNKPIRVYTYTNCQSVELLLNGKSIGEKRKADFQNGVVRWFLNYAPGELIAVGKNDEKEVCRHILNTAGKPSSLKLSAYKSTIGTSNDDVFQIEVNAVDENGVLCPYANNLINFELIGNGEIAGVDNGDMADHYNWKGAQVQLYNGRAIVYVKSHGKPGELLLKANTSGLNRSDITLTIK